MRRPRPALLSSALGLACALALPGALQSATPAACPAMTAYKGAAFAAPGRATPFIMLSAYNLEPYSPRYLDDALADIARHGVAGLVYTTLGETSERFARRGVAGDEIAYNRTIFERARGSGARIWLQARIYGNRLAVEAGEAPRNVAAEEILSSPPARQAFQARLRSEVGAYRAVFPGEACRVVVFEEAGMYHSPQGGGYFWSSQRALQRRSPAADALFSRRLAGVFSLARSTIKTIDPGCRVGFHLGHSAVDAMAGLKDALGAAGVKPDFVLYDLYQQARRDPADFPPLLRRRAAALRTLGVPVYYLGQLHTMNAFQSGGGRTPSRADIDRVVDMAVELGFEAVGFYTKNALPTNPAAPENDDAFDPNRRGQATVYESSKDRWDYGIERLAEAGGTDLGRRFDLLVEGADATLALRGRDGRWTEVGTTPAGPGVFAFRGLEAERYFGGPRGGEIRLTGAAQARVWLAPTLPARRFRTAAEQSEEVRGQGRPTGAVVARTLRSGEPAALCLT